MAESTIVSLYSQLESCSECLVGKKLPIKDKRSCVTNGCMLDQKVFVLREYIMCLVCLHLTRPVLGSYIVISPPKKQECFDHLSWCDRYQPTFFPASVTHWLCFWCVDDFGTVWLRMYFKSVFHIHLKNDCCLSYCSEGLQQKKINI